MGVLKGSLCLCDASSYDVTDIWVMKDYGVKESWFKEFKIDTSHLDRWPTGLCQPIDVLKSGDLLMYHANNALVSYNGVEFKYFKICEIESKFLAVAHIPSFVSLKDMMGDKVENCFTGGNLPKDEFLSTITKIRTHYGFDINNDISEAIANAKICHSRDF
ncbi:hypothetical protein L1049_001689 [Liquidambar formosana]|uniref:Uncharacterized protein n=1 Tax=Liquidambar formosana TaxID=63359 RepID=A0AAP0N5P8_LIQFO